jgi:aminopeptidase N
LKATLRSFVAICILAVAWPSVLTAADTPLTYHDITAKFDPRTRQLNVTDRITFQARAEITFRLADWLEITQARLGDKRVTPRKEHQYWKISTPDPTNKQLTLSLTGKVPPLPPQKQRRSVRGAVAGVEGSYVPGSAAWIADTGEDWVKFSLKIEVSENQRAVATGRFVGEEQQGATYSARFAADYPAELPSIFVGPYSVNERRFDKVRLRTYFHDDIAAFADDYLSTAGQYLRDFAARIGVYPFDDFHIISAPLPVGYGFPNLTYVGRMIVPYPFMRGQSLAHEVLHNWWGNGVAVDHARGNWAEGLTTYMADYALATKRGPGAAQKMRLGWLRDYAALPRVRDMAIAKFQSKSHQASQVIGYNKVAFVFHMLRGELGESRFANGLKLFWQRNKFKVAGWRQIQAAFEEVSGEDLGWFFKQWLFRAGAPRIRLHEAKVVNGQAVVISIRQNTPTYRFTVPIDVETPQGRKRHWVPMDDKEKIVELPIAGKLLSVSVDPTFDVFRRLLPGESPPILRDVTLAKKIALHILSSKPSFNAAAKTLIARLFAESQVVSGLDPQAPVSGPTVVIGGRQQIADYLERIHENDLPAEVEAGTAAAWVTRVAGGHTVLLLHADNAEAVKKILRPLPHYGRQSYIIFAGRRVVQKGTWPMASSPLRLSFQN